jgi:hypothetical protein
VGVDKASGSWSVEDRVSGPRSVGGRIVYHLSPDITNRGGELLEKETSAPIVRMEAGGVSLETQNYRYSPEYGVAVRARRLSLRIPDLTNAAIRTVFSRPHVGVAVPTDRSRTAVAGGPS